MKRLTYIWIFGLLIATTAYSTKTVSPADGGTGEDSSSWEGIPQVDGGTWSTMNNIKTIEMYSSLTAAVTSIGSTETTLIVNDTTTLTANTTLPSTLHIQFARDGLIQLGNYDLNINGSFQSGLWQVFDYTGTGTVVFGDGSVSNVYPEWWGGKADNGTTDNKNAFQRALDAFPVVKAGSAGVYVSGYGITLNSNNRLIADSRESILKLDDEQDSAIISASGKDNIEIRNWTVDGNKANQTSNNSTIVISNSTNVVIDGVKIVDTMDRGIALTVSSGQTLSNITIQNCSFSGITESAIGLDNSASPYVLNRGTAKKIKILNNEINANIGIRFWGASETIVSGNILEFSGSIGVACSAVATDVIITNNNIKATGTGSAISLALANGAKNISITGNKVYGSSATDGIEIIALTSDSASATTETINITANTIQGFSNGIELKAQGVNGNTASLKGVTASGNAIKANLAGIITAASGATRHENIAVIGNTVEITAKANSNYRGIIVRDNNATQITKNVTISGNVVNGAYYGIYLNSTGGGGGINVSGNHLHSNEYGFCVVTGASSPAIMIKGNSFYNNTSQDMSWIAPGGVWKTLKAPDITNRTVTIADDAATSFYPVYETGVLHVTSEDDTSRSGVIIYRADATVYAREIVEVTTGANFSTGLGALFGTTGTDGEVTVKAHTDGKIYIENRSGASLKISYNLLSGTN